MDVIVGAADDTENHRKESDHGMKVSVRTVTQSQTQSFNTLNLTFKRSHTKKEACSKSLN